MFSYLDTYLAILNAFMHKLSCAIDMHTWYCIVSHGHMGSYDLVRNINILCVHLQHRAMQYSAPGQGAERKKSPAGKHVRRMKRKRTAVYVAVLGQPLHSTHLGGRDKPPLTDRNYVPI